MTFAIKVDTSGIDALLGQLGSDVDEAVRPAAQAGAQVLYDAVKQNVRALGRKTGNLDKAIYQVYSKALSNETKATYQVSWNAKKAPHGHLVESGYIQKFKVYMGKNGVWYTNKKAPLAQPRQVGARAFVRGAAAQFPRALDAIEAELLRRIK